MAKCRFCEAALTFGECISHVKTPLFCDEECEENYADHFGFKPRSHIAKANSPYAKTHIEFERIKHNFLEGCEISRQLLRAKYNMVSLWNGEKLIQV